MRVKGFWKASLTGAAALLLGASGAHAAAFSVGSASGEPGDTVAVGVTLATEGDEVAGAELEIGSGAGVAVAANDNDRPDCAVNPDINKGATAFSFQPAGCTPGDDCERVKAIVLALDNVDPIDDGAVMFTCQVAIAGDATPGGVTLPCTNPRGSDSAGGAVDATCTDGTVTVEGDIVVDPPLISIGSAEGEAGSTVVVSVSLETDGAEIAGSENEIVYDASAPIAANDNDRPDCSVNDAINKGATAFSFQPAGCTPGDDCERVKAIVLALDNVDPIPDGSVLYTCNVELPSQGGPFALTCSNPRGSDSAGGSVDLNCTDGEVRIVEEPPTFTPTEVPPTETPAPPTDTPTEAPPTDTPTEVPPTETQVPDTPVPSGDEDDGCQVVAPAHASSGWLLLLPAAALLWLRRRVR